VRPIRPSRDRPLPDRDPDQLLRDAVALRALLDDLADDEHEMRARLLEARLQLRLEAAWQWRRRGWRPITERF
jgi:hypothetical protein